MVDKEVVVVDTFREGNKLADFLTNKVVNFAGADSIQFNHTDKLPVHGKAILQLDKQGIPNIRIKKGQDNFFKHPR